MGSLTKATTETFGTGGVNSTNIQNDSITGAKIASDAAIDQSKLSITFPTISSLSITNGQSKVFDTETVDINGTNFVNGASVEFIQSTTNALFKLPTVTFVSATQLRVTVPASTLTEGDDYKIRVENPNGLAAISSGAVGYSQTVSFSTSSGSLGSVAEGGSASFTVSASSNSTIAYTVTSGSLPSGLSLNSSTGAITGTAPNISADTTSTFTITATDAESQTASRSFSITVIDFSITNSLRFNDDDSPDLKRTPSSAGNRAVWTWSAWLKINPLGTHNIFTAGGWSAGQDGTGLALINGQFYSYWNTPSSPTISSAHFRDPSAWYHVVLQANTSTLKVYVNGVERSSKSISGNGAINNTNEMVMGRYSNTTGGHFDGYMAEVHFIDGTAKAPTDFGETDSTTNNWIPKKYSGSYGTNGVYLDFADSGNLGDDESGNTNDFTATNLAATDQTTDTPNNNFATLNPLDRAVENNSGGITLSEGNLEAVGVNGGNRSRVQSTIGVSSGKWYAEFKIKNGNDHKTGLGIIDARGSNANLGNVNHGIEYRPNDDQIQIYDAGSNGAAQTGLTGATNNDIVGIALDADASTPTVQFYLQGNALGNPVNYDLTIEDRTFFFFVRDGSNSGSDEPHYVCNFGNIPSTISSPSTDANGYGKFYYAPPSGYLALCTNNLPNVAIADPTEHFNTILYTGTSANPTSRTGVGFQPDWIWAKERSSTSSHRWIDSSRGKDKVLESNATDVEVTRGDIQSFNSDGFTTDDGGAINESGQTYVAWNWKANGGTTSSNTSGSITSTVQANTTAGFSIVTWTETTANSQTIGHGLGKTPAMIITKLRDNAVLDPAWYTFHQSLGIGERVMLDSTSGDVTSGFFNGTLNSSVFHVGYGDSYDNTQAVAYCFAEIEGYSKFGSYTGNGNADGPFIYTGFKPAWIMFKKSSDTGDWIIMDAKRTNEFNPTNGTLYANLSNAEATSIDRGDCVSNGYKLRNTSAAVNTSGATYIYMAFAEAPFKSGTGATSIEGTAR